MILKYLYRTAFIALCVLTLTSCLGRGENNTVGELSHDARIHAFSLSSKKDTTRALSDIKFTIDQLNGKIFNIDSLPFRFHVDSVMPTIRRAGVRSAAKVVVLLKQNDSSYVWNGKDSLAFNRLKGFEVTSEDAKSIKRYEFSANIYQHNPYILQWSKMAENQFSSQSIRDQKTISVNGKFITYYKSNNALLAASSPDNSGESWKSETLSGLPETVKLRSVSVIANSNTKTVYAQNVDNSIYQSADGLAWKKLAPKYPVLAVYGKLPSASGEFAILTAIVDGGKQKFATTKDFSEFKVMNEVPENMPISDFSALSHESTITFAAKFIYLAGGKDSKNAENKSFWILQENDGKITNPNPLPFASQIAQMFLYDNKVYLLTYADGKNKLYFSNFGNEWSDGGKDQVLPEQFVARLGTSIITDANNFIWIFGGESGSHTQIVDVWRGRLNKLAK